MHCPWIVRTVALLLVLVGLQAGAFRDLDTGHEWYFGTEDASAAVRPEARKSDVLPVHPPSAQPPRWVAALTFTAFASPARRATGGGACSQRLLPDPTGPPRA